MDCHLFLHDFSPCLGFTCKEENMISVPTKVATYEIVDKQIQERVLPCPYMYIFNTTAYLSIVKNDHN